MYLYSMSEWNMIFKEKKMKEWVLDSENWAHGIEFLYKLHIYM